MLSRIRQFRRYEPDVWGGLRFISVLAAIVALTIGGRYYIQPARYYGGASDRLAIAASVGDVNGISDALGAGANCNPRDPLSPSPLLMAVESGNIDAVQLLLSAGADPSQPFGCLSPLNMAIHSHDTQILRLLLDSGADTSQPVELPALEAAHRCEDPECVQILEEANAMKKSSSIVSR
ncbi:MAG TPA: ankyrin repeat domain-containing protein [Tepidisphaeraceae bacterium]|nr:ankyrin repeat domain-containing protein [Tepidisphaeraceae bacterium]